MSICLTAWITPYYKTKTKTKCWVHTKWLAYQLWRLIIYRNDSIVTWGTGTMMSTFKVVTFLRASSKLAAFINVCKETNSETGELNSTEGADSISKVSGPDKTFLSLIFSPTWPLPTNFFFVTSHESGIFSPPLQISTIGRTTRENEHRCETLCTHHNIQTWLLLIILTCKNTRSDITNSKKNKYFYQKNS